LGVSELTPIIIMSFNRPHFLEPTLQSLLDQRDDAIRDREVHLFQDGAVNRYSHIRYARDEDIDGSVSIFSKAFPKGVIHKSPDNIGIFESFRRAEAFCFRERGFNCAYFFEDDLILSPVYLEVMDELKDWAVAEENVAYFAAYGNYYADAQELRDHKHELMALDHHWAFGLLREPWKKLQPLLADYEAIVGGEDYSRRDHRRVFDLYKNSDIAPRASSQDAAKALACSRLGLWRANTYVPFARYIGTTGQHMTPEQFKELGFERTLMSKDKVRIIPPSGSRVQELIEEQAALFRSIRAEEYAGLVEALPNRYLNPLRLCSREDVRYGYELLLNRPPEDESVYQRLVDHHSVISFIRGVTGSEEFRGLSLDERSRLATREDVLYAYRLTLHRDPENEAIFSSHVGITDARQLILSIWNSQSRNSLWKTLE
jgi:hypothetical protein